MAIYHLSAQLISRANGRSVVAAAAYRAGAQLTDARTGLSHDYHRKQGIAHTEILAPENAPNWVHDRQLLWNAVEAVERRRDAQLAREIQIALPRELDFVQQLALIRAFADHEFVQRGMIVDLAVHTDNPENPHAHLLLTTREINVQGFGPKNRSWNQKDHLLAWRQAWAELANQHLQQAGFEHAIDHRSYPAQGIPLEPQRKLGVNPHWVERGQILDYLQNRQAEHQRIARDNGERIRWNPGLALDALTHQQATFSDHDLARFLNTHTADAEQFQTVLAVVKASSELIPLGEDERGQVRFTSQRMLDTEHRLLATAQRLAKRSGHPVAAEYLQQAQPMGESLAHSSSSAPTSTLSPTQAAACQALIGPQDLVLLQGYAGSGKSQLLGTARQAWEAQGYRVKGAALAGIAAEQLELAAGIPSRTLASYEYAWSQGQERLNKGDVLVIDEAGMLGTRQLERVLSQVARQGAKAVLVGDSQQLQAIEAGAPFRAIGERVGQTILGEIHRQRTPWQQQATLDCAIGHPERAVRAYWERGATLPLPDRETALKTLLRDCEADRQQSPGASRLMLAYTRADVASLNARARAVRQAQGALRHAQRVTTARGPRDIAPGERLYCLRNDRALGVKNGSLGTVQRIRGSEISLRLDGPEPRTVVFDTRDYNHLDYGYAATVHKAQGVTVDRAYVLATPHFDQHATYVALSRHRDAVRLYWGQDDFGSARALVKRLSRARPKTLAVEYAERRGLGLGLGSEGLALGSDRAAGAAPLESRAPVESPAAAERQSRPVAESVPVPAPTAAAAAAAKDRYTYGEVAASTLRDWVADQQAALQRQYADNMGRLQQAEEWARVSPTRARTDAVDAVGGMRYNSAQRDVYRTEFHRDWCRDRLALLETRLRDSGWRRWLPGSDIRAERDVIRQQLAEAEDKWQQARTELDTVENWLKDPVQQAQIEKHYARQLQRSASAQETLQRLPSRQQGLQKAIRALDAKLYLLQRMGDIPVPIRWQENAQGRTWAIDRQRVPSPPVPTLPVQQIIDAMQAGRPEALANLTLDGYRPRALTALQHAADTLSRVLVPRVQALVENRPAYRQALQDHTRAESNYSFAQQSRYRFERDHPVQAVMAARGIGKGADYWARERDCAAQLATAQAKLEQEERNNRSPALQNQAQAQVDHLQGQRNAAELIQDKIHEAHAQRALQELSRGSSPARLWELQQQHQLQQDQGLDLGL